MSEIDPRYDVVMSWEDLANLTHATQVEKFNFCTCEDGPAVYADCPSAIARATAGRRALEAHSNHLQDAYGNGEAWDSYENVIDTLTDIAHAVGTARFDTLLQMALHHVDAELRGGDND